jgi:hypothetical protein
MCPRTLRSPDPVTDGVAGDCRTFNADADWSQSRVQIYIDPASGLWEVEWNSTRFIFGPEMRVYNDFADVFRPSDVTVEPVEGSPGSFIVTARLQNNVCAHFFVMCVPIDATVRFDPDPSKPGGYDVHFTRDAFPAIGTYMDGPSGFTTMKEDPQRAWNLYEALLRLLGQFKSTAQNVPPPVNPNGCSVT